MADFLLVHGSCHGAWCWRDLIPVLESLGHSVRAIDMPSHGADPTPIADVTLDGCRDSILSATTPETIIVGHSWGGYPISAAAEAQPDAMRALIYLSAYVPQDGLSMVEMRRRGPSQTIADAVEKSADGLSYTVRPDCVRELFYHDCDPDITPYAFGRLCPQAIRPQDTPLHLGTRYQKVPRAYIATSDDHTVPFEYQCKMSEDIPSAFRRTIHSGHSAFFSHPDQLANILSDLKQQLSHHQT